MRKLYNLENAKYNYKKEKSKKGNKVLILKRKGREIRLYALL